MVKIKTDRVVFNRSSFEQLVSFILLQAVTVGTIALRLPLISSNSSTPILASFLFWTGMIPVSQLISVGVVNRARVTVIQKSTKKFYRNSKLSETLVSSALLALLLTPYFADMSGVPLTLIGIPVLLVAMVISTYFSEALGIAQGLGKNPIVNYVLAASSIASLGLTWIGYHFGLATQDSETQLSFLLDISLFVSISGYVFAFFLVRRRLTRKTTESLSIASLLRSIRSDTLEFLFSMPPVLFTALDLVLLSVFSSDLEVLQYGFYSRCAVLASIVPAALYLPLSNRLTGKQATSLLQDFKPAWVLTMANLPFIAVFVFLGPWFADFISSGLSVASIELVLAFALVSILQPLWIVIQSHLSAELAVRAEVAKRILFVVVPVSVLSSGIGALLFGATGSVTATSISYLAAIGVAIPFYLRQSAVRK